MDAALPLTHVGQKDAYFGALPGLAGYLQPPPMPLQNLLADGQSQAQPLRPTFGGIERLEDLLQFLG